MSESATGNSKKFILMESDAIDELIGKWLDDRISQSESERLQDELRRSPDARQRLHELVQLDSTLRDIAEADLGVDSFGLPEIERRANELNGSIQRRSSSSIQSRWIQVVVAASLLFICAWLSYRKGKNSTVGSLKQGTSDAVETELAGFATLRRVAGIQWAESALDPASGTTSKFREGDILTKGAIEFLAGVMEVDFFCGASVVVEGPAKIELESDWALRLHHGRMRANVPPAARGFTVNAAESQIIDLGTEFALEVGPDTARVEVIDGEIELRGGDHSGARLLTGQRRVLSGPTETNDSGLLESLASVSTVADVQRQNELEREQRMQRWRVASQRIRQDRRLIAYFPIAEMQAGRRVTNQALRTTTPSDRDGVLVGSVERTEGRFGSLSSGLKFDQPGSRVRVRIDGEYEAFTMMCWVKINRLTHRYNALFMGDGYENGEPHWQIRNDGKLMFSVMVDDSRDVEVRSIQDNAIVKDAGKHRVYFTESIWDSTQPGQWSHLAAVYDPGDRVVRQYVNGEEVASEEILDEFYVDRLRIGPAEIGNWGQPFRPSPWFAVRNLDGVIDELSIYNSALESNEIRSMYGMGKPYED